jgi:tetratricopeptide (TPR) repeat protein
MEAYRDMLAIARYLAEADASDRRAQSDYGIALMRMAGGMPDSMAKEKYDCYRQARDRLRAADRATPGGIGNRINLAYIEYQMGEWAPGPGREAHYRAAASLAESLLQSRSTSAVGTLVLACRRLGEIAARRGQMDEALEWGRKGLDAAEQPQHKARAMSAMGAIYAAGGRRAEAVEWYRKAVALWREQATKPAFPQRDRQDYKEASEALARLLPR